MPTVDKVVPERYAWGSKELRLENDMAVCKLTNLKEKLKHWTPTDKQRKSLEESGNPWVKGQSLSNLYSHIQHLTKPINSGTPAFSDKTVERARKGDWIRVENAEFIAAVLNMSLKDLGVEFRHRAAGDGSASQPSAADASSRDWIREELGAVADVRIKEFAHSTEALEVLWTTVREGYNGKLEKFRADIEKVERIVAYRRARRLVAELQNRFATKIKPNLEKQLKDISPKQFLGQLEEKSLLDLEVMHRQWVQLSSERAADHKQVDRRDRKAVNEWAALHLRPVAQADPVPPLGNMPSAESAVT